jgi:hypothetical protein
MRIDLYFLKNRLSVTYDYYNRQTKDMLYRGDLPLSGGMSYYFSSDDPANTVPVYFNAGLVGNQGHEISLGWKNKNRKLFYSINANASFNSNLVKQVGDQPGATPIDEGLDNTWSLLSRTQDGNPMSMFYGKAPVFRARNRWMNIMQERSKHGERKTPLIPALIRLPGSL